jgi:hypothetical protein
MAAAITTPKFFNLQHIMPVTCYLNKAAQADWMTINGYPGVIPLQATVKLTTTGANMTETLFSYGAVTNTTTSAAAITSIAVTGFTNTDRTGATPFYLLTPAGEIVMVTGDSAPTNANSTLTIQRGCLGTTAGTITATDVLAVLNCVIFGIGTAVGKGFFTFLPLPTEPKALLVNQS